MKEPTKECLPPTQEQQNWIFAFYNLVKKENLVCDRDAYVKAVIDFSLAFSNFKLQEASEVLLLKAFGYFVKEDMNINKLVRSIGYDGMPSLKTAMLNSTSAMLANEKKEDDALLVLSIFLTSIGYEDFCKLIKNNFKELGVKDVPLS